MKEIDNLDLIKATNEILTSLHDCIMKFEATLERKWDDPAESWIFSKEYLMRFDLGSGGIEYNKTMAIIIDKLTGLGLDWKIESHTGRFVSVSAKERVKSAFQPD